MKRLAVPIRAIFLKRLLAASTIAGAGAMVIAAGVAAPARAGTVTLSNLGWV
jgi:hypothetical protein